MQLTEIFQVLGIEVTKDQRAIKNAYREKLAVTNPEDNPEGFKRLRAAYEEACVYASRTEEDQIPERDETPSGLWVEKAAGIYKNIHTRQDADKWKELFEEDIFLSLEEEENCRFKLLRFLMDNFKLPTDVWKLLDEKLNITEDAQKLRETFPADFIHYVVSKCERGEDVEFSQFEGDPEADYDLYLRYYDCCWNALQEKQYDQAAEYIKNADELNIFHPVIEVCRAHLLVAQEKMEEAVGHLEKLLLRYPADAMVCYNAAEILWSHDRKERAAEIYKGLKEANDKHYMANVRLTEWYYEQGEFEEAKKCAEKVLSSGADDDFMDILAKVNSQLEKSLLMHYRTEKVAHSALELGWCYLQDGKVEQGIRLVESLKGNVPQDRRSEYLGLLTKLYMEETEYEKAAAMAVRWEEALQERLASEEPEEEKEKDRDRVRQYHLIRMQCHRAMGDMKSTRKPEECRKDYEAAIMEADGQMSGTSQDIGLLLEKAQIYMDMEEYEKSLEVLRILTEEHQVYAAYATELEVHRREWNASGVVQAGRQCIHYFPNYIRAYEHIAKVFLDLKRPEDLNAILDEAKQNNIESPILDAYNYQKDHEVPETEVLDRALEAFRKEYFARVEKGDMKAYEEGLPRLTEYLYWYPGTYMLVERGLFHRAARHYEEAKADFEKALAENPHQPYALNGLSFTYKYMGDYEKALIYIKRAIRYRDPEMSDFIYADMADLYSLLGNFKEAVNAYEKFAASNGYKNVYHVSRLAMCKARNGEVDQAVSLLTSAYKENTWKRYDQTVNLYQLTGKQTMAAALLADWEKELSQTSANKFVGYEPYKNLYIRLAWQDALFGEGLRAVEYYEKAMSYEERMHTSEEWKMCGTLSDAVYMCIICGDEKKGRELSAKLRLYMQKAKSAGKQIYDNMDKQLAQTEFHAYYYMEPWDGEEMKTILEVGRASEACRYCDYCICKELEAAWILWLMKSGKKEEAMERLAENLERQPLDEYALTIKHMYEIGGFDRKIQSPAGSESASGTGKAVQKKEKATANLGLMSKLKGLFGKK